MIRLALFTLAMAWIILFAPNIHASEIQELITPEEQQMQINECTMAQENLMFETRAYIDSQNRILKTEILKEINESEARIEQKIKDLYNPFYQGLPTIAIILILAVLYLILKAKGKT